MCAVQEAGRSDFYHVSAQVRISLLQSVLRYRRCVMVLTQSRHIAIEREH